MSARETYTQYVEDLKSTLDRFPMDGLEAATRMIEEAFEQGKLVIIAGNGGSAATASHLACDFQKTTLGKGAVLPKHRFRAVALTDNMPLITAWGNDTAYEVVFSEQLRNLARAGDLLIVISASGNSPNVLRALEAAKELGVKTIGFLGFGGGKAAPMVDMALVVDSHDYGIVEDAHSIFMHMLTAHLKSRVLAPA